MPALEGSGKHLPCRRWRWQVPANLAVAAAEAIRASTAVSTDKVGAGAAVLAPGLSVVRWHPAICCG